MLLVDSMLKKAETIADHIKQGKKEGFESVIKMLERETEELFNTSRDLKRLYSKISSEVEKEELRRKVFFGHCISAYVE